MQLRQGVSWALGLLVVSQLTLAGAGHAAEPAQPPSAQPQPAQPAPPPPPPPQPVPEQPVSQPPPAPPQALAPQQPPPAPPQPLAPQQPPAPPEPAPPPPEPDTSAGGDAPAERRSGFTFGMSGGLLTGAARGYPNDVAKIGYAEYRTETGVGLSSGGALWLGGALADWLNVGIGVFGGGFERNGLRLSGGVFQARIELFPLFYQGGELRDLGVLLTAGTGAVVIERGSETVAEGPGTSAVGAGVFYEPWRWWQLTFGPQLEYVYQFSDGMRSHTFVAGVRTAFYGGP